MKLRWSIGARKADKSSIKTPAKGNSVKPQAVLDDLTAKEELFFDSQPWLESDCEDYFSVNGDFSPSRGNTPIHPSSLVETPAPYKPVAIGDVIPQPSPKKRLSELFCESTDQQPVVENLNPSAGNSELDTKSTNGRGTRSSNGDGTSPYAFITSSHGSSERTPNRFGAFGKQSKEKSGRSSPCCFPALGRSFSFGDKKKRFSSAQNGAW